MDGEKPTRLRRDGVEDIEKKTMIETAARQWRQATLSLASQCWASPAIRLPQEEKLQQLRIKG